MTGPTLDDRFLILNKHVTLRVLREGSQTYEGVLVMREKGRRLPPCTQDITESDDPYLFTI